MFIRNIITPLTSLLMVFFPALPGAQSPELNGITTTTLPPAIAVTSPPTSDLRTSIRASSRRQQPTRFICETEFGRCKIYSSVYLPQFSDCTCSGDPGVTVATLR